MKRLKLFGFDISIHQFNLPSTLRELDITIDESRTAESVFDALLLISSISLETIHLRCLRPHDPHLLLPDSLIEYFSLRGSTLRHLNLRKFKTDFVTILLPFTTSLHTLQLPSSGILASNILFLQSFSITSSSSSTLKILDLGNFDINACTRPGFLLPLLNLPQLSSLHTIHYGIPTSTAEAVGDLVWMHGRSKGKYKDFKLRGRIDFAVEVMKGRGIRLSLVSYGDDKRHRN